jgi:CHAD domain-containing protein
MGFGWDTTRDPCDDAVRAAAGQLRIALRELRGAGRARRGAAERGARPDADAAVHEARKALRRARAMAELLRPLAGADLAGDLVDAVRGARRRLSTARDDAVLPAALGAACGERGDPGDAGAGGPPGSAIAPLRALLAPEGGGAQAGVDPETVAAIAAALEGARHDLTRLHAVARAAGGDLEPLGRGLRRMHRRARAAAGAAQAAVAAGSDTADDALHDARKRFKELAYAMRWWAPAWRRPIEAWLLEVDTLVDLIGVDHDQVVLRSRLRRLGDAVDGEVLARVYAGSERRSARLRGKAARALVRLAAEPSGAFVARHVGYMASARAWRLQRG